MAENEAKKLKGQQEIAKAKSRSRIAEPSAIGGKELKIEQYNIEAPLIIRKCKHGERTEDINRSRYEEKTQSIAQSWQERNLVVLKNEQILYNLLKPHSARDVDLDVFDGNPLEYHYFMTLFHKLVEKQTDD